jgi:hypothetical protein
MSRNTTRTTGTAAMVLASALAAHAQVGSGWTQYSPSSTLQNDDTGGCSYTNSGGIETFRMFDPVCNRIERRVNNNYTTGERQFQGEVRVSSPTNDEAIHQVFGRDNADDGSAPAMLIRAYSAGGGYLTRSGWAGSKTLVSAVYGTWVRINTIHNTSANTIDTYVNGSLKDAGYPGGGNVNHYTKYGSYGTLKTSSAKVEWRNVRHYRK